METSAGAAAERGRAELRGAAACAMGVRAVPPSWDAPAQPQALAPAPRTPLARPALCSPAPLTAELKRRWQMLQEMNCFFLSGAGTPKVWLITAFCTGSIWKGREGRGRLGATLRWLPWHGTVTRRSPAPTTLAEEPLQTPAELAPGAWKERAAGSPVCHGGTPRTGQRAPRRRLFLSFLHHPCENQTCRVQMPAGVWQRGRGRCGGTGCGPCPPWPCRAPLRVPPVPSPPTTDTGVTGGKLSVSV